MIWPVKKVYITQKWGVNRDIYKRFGFKGHNGIDLRLHQGNGTPIFAPHDGTIRERRFDADGYGKYLKIESNKEGSILAHLKDWNVNVNKNVKEGDLVGWGDNTGWSTGPHLHWGYYRSPRDRQNGYGGTIDPTPYIDSNDIIDTPQIEDEPMKFINQTIIPLGKYGDMQLQKVRGELAEKKKVKKEYEALKEVHEKIKEEYDIELEKARKSAKAWQEKYDYLMDGVAGRLGEKEEVELVFLELNRVLKIEKVKEDIDDNRPVGIKENIFVTFIEAMKDVFIFISKRRKERELLIKKE